MAVTPDLQGFRPALIPRLKRLLRELHPSSLLRSDRIGLPPPSADQPEYLLAAGKASKGMAETLAKERSIPPERVLVVLPLGYPHPDKLPWTTGNHPDPGEESLTAAQSSLRFVEEIPSGGVLLFALSGGTSSLLCMPVPGVTLEQKRTLIGKLMRKGAPIDVLNTVRTHLSSIKGGELLRNFRGRHVHTVLLSDVPCHPAGIVGSGPTAFCHRDGKNTLSILEKWLDPDDIPDSVRQHLDSMLSPEPPPFSREHLHVLGDSGLVLETASRILAFSGMRLHPVTPCLTGEARIQAEKMASLVREVADRDPGNHLFLASGECTVNLGKKHGRGGRTLELGIACGLSLKNFEAVIGAVATDGVDGSSGCSGILLESSLFREKGKEKKALQALEEHDTASFAHREDIGLLFGPTGTNLNDLLFVYFFQPTEVAPR